MKNNFKHGLSQTGPYRVWMSMKQRCKNRPKYQQRGICEEWMDVRVFYKWAMENGYKEGTGQTIERRNNDLGYSPENCYFAPNSVQQRNRSDNVKITAFGEVKGLKDWAEDKRCVVPYRTLARRIELRWDHRRALTEPLHFEKRIGGLILRHGRNIDEDDAADNQETMLHCSVVVSESSDNTTILPQKEGKNDPFFGYSYCI